MKTLNYKLISVKSCVIAAVLFISLTLSVQSAFSQGIADYQENVAPNDWHWESQDLGGGSKEYKWRISYDLFDWGIWNFDIWNPNIGSGNMSQYRVEKVGYDALFTELTVLDTNGYGTYYPGQTYDVLVKVREQGVDIISGLPYFLDYVKGHRYACY